MADAAVLREPFRLAALQGALIGGVHADQQRLVGSVPGASSWFALGSDDAVPRVAVLRRLLGAIDRVVAWCGGAADPAIAADVASLAQRPAPDAARLPVHAVAAALRARGARDDRGITAVANLVQFNLQETEDGGLLQDLFHLYHRLGLPLNVAQLGLRAADDDLLALARECAATADAGPFPANDLAYWRLTFTRVAMWGDKISGRRDVRVLARELVAEPEIAALLPALAALPARRLACIGHSMQMSVNWSTHGAWNDLAAEVVRSVNPRFEIAHFLRGGVRAGAALRDLLPPALAWRPTHAFVLTAVEDEADGEALGELAATLRAAGCEPCLIDEVRPWYDTPADHAAIAWRRAACARGNGRWLAWQRLGRAAEADPRAWMCLDDIHMTTPGHLFYARQALRLWAGAGG